MRASLLLITALLVGACAPGATPVPSPTAEVHELVGTFTLSASGLSSSADTCRGTGGYVDVAPGLSVVVRDQSNTILATGALETGKARGQTMCSFAFHVPGIPPATFYTVEVGHRGQITYSFADMTNNAWQVTLTLGGS